MFEKILVPLDGSELSEGILPYVSKLAIGLNSQLALLSVLDPEELEERHASSVLKGVEAHVRQRLEEISGELSAQGVNTKTVFSHGKPADEIVQAAREQGCDVIAMSTHGRSMFGRGVLGSVTDKVIHSAHLPVLTITPDRAKKYREDGISITKIMAPLDGSPLAESILPYVEELAGKLSLGISIVRVLKTGGVPASYLERHPYEGLDQIEADIKSDATIYLESIAGGLREKGLTVEWKLASGAPAICILDLAKEEPHDLICIATHGRSGITRWVMGSVAETLVRASNDPVLVIPSTQS